MTEAIPPYPFEITPEQEVELACQPLPRLVGKKLKFARAFIEQGYWNHSKAYIAAGYPQTDYPTESAQRLLHNCPEIGRYISISRARSNLEIQAALSEVLKINRDIMLNPSTHNRDRTAASIVVARILQRRVPGEVGVDGSVEVHVSLSNPSSAVKPESTPEPTQPDTPTAP